MTEYRRDKILPEDLIQRTNLSQHNMMIDAINDIDGRQVDIEHITNVNIDDIVDLKTDVIALSNEKLDKDDIDADLHFGDITVTRDGTAVIMSLDVLNPTTNIITPISFTIPGATSAEAGTMDASSVSWIADAEERISALEGLSDVKAVADLPGTPDQSQLTTGWVAVAGKQPETGDILQDIDNSKLWVFVGTDWVLYGTIVTVPLATTSTIGGVRDTSLTAPGNRWYIHVEADGRLALIGGDSLTTLIDTTIPALQLGVSSKVSKSGDTMTGPLFVDTNNQWPISIITDVTYPFGIKDKTTGERLFAIYHPVGAPPTLQILGPDNNTNRWNLGSAGIIYSGTHRLAEDPPADDNTRSLPSCRWVRARLADKQNALTFDDAPVSGSNNPVKSGGVYDALADKQDSLTFDNIPAAGSGNPVKSGGVYDALTAKADTPEWTYGSGTLTTNNGTTGYNYAYYTIGDVVTMRFTIGPSMADQFYIPLPISVTSASVQCMGISDRATFWTDYDGTVTPSIHVNRAQDTPVERSFHMTVIGQPST